MNLTTLIIGMVCFASCTCTCTCTFDGVKEEKQYYLRKVHQMAGLDFGHGEIYNKPDLIDALQDMTLGDLKVTSVKLYTALECSYIMNIYIHSSAFKSYWLFKTKPVLTADEIRMYSFVEEAQRMLTAMHNAEVYYSTAKYIMWTYLVYTEKMASIMREPRKNYSSAEKEMITFVHQSVVWLLTQFFVEQSCEQFYYKKKDLLSNWPAVERPTIDVWTKSIKITRKTVLEQLDFNDGRGVNSTDAGMLCTLDALHLKGVFDQFGKLNYLLKTFLVNSDWSAIKFKTYGLSLLPDNVDWNSLQISSVSFSELQQTVHQADYFPSLVQQIKHLKKIHTSLVRILKAIALQLIDQFLSTIKKTMLWECVEHRITAQMLDINEDMANQLSAFVDSLDLGHDENLSEIVQFFHRILYSGRLSVSEVSDTIRSLNKSLKRTGEQLLDGPIIKNIKFEGVQTKPVDSKKSAADINSVVQPKDTTTKKLRGLVNNLKEINLYIKENVTTFVNFKVINSFKDITFSEEFSKLQQLEASFKPQSN